MEDPHRRATEDLYRRYGVGSYSELLRVLSRRQTIELAGVSEKTWERLEAVGDIPIKTQLSQGRIGFRLDHIKEWLDRRQIGAGDTAAACTNTVQP